MIRTLMQVSWKNLMRDRAAQLLVFVVPIAFYSIFALVFGQSNDTSMPRVRVLVVDESRTPASAGLVAALQADSGLRVSTAWRRAPGDTTRVPLDRARAEALVRGGEAPVAIVLPPGIDTSIARFGAGGTKALLLTDPSDRVAPQVAAGMLQKAALRAGRAEAEEFGGAAAGGGGDPAEDLMPVRTERRDVVGTTDRRDGGITSFYAAAIAVMFLMFSASGAGGALLEESEAGTLERVLTSRVGMTRLLAAKWLHIVWLGVLQITVMYAWGMLVFRVPLLSHLPGFAVMTLATAACTAAFGLVLATLSRSRQQLAGLANLIVLSLSAIGGSMYPRPFMSETLQKVSLVGFNAWALDGYTKVFWRDEPVPALWTQVAMLALFTVLFLALARRFARRWEAA